MAKVKVLSGPAIIHGRIQKAVAGISVTCRSGEGRSGEGRSGHVLIYTATAAAAAAAVVAAAAAVARDLPLDRRSYGSATRSEIATAT
ncbi:unnamed protein product [Closterium sp. NIES-53]